MGCPPHTVPSATGRGVKHVSRVNWACDSPSCGMKATVGLGGIWGQGQGPGCVRVPQTLMSYPRSPAKSVSLTRVRCGRWRAASARDTCPRQVDGQAGGQPAQPETPQDLKLWPQA